MSDNTLRLESGFQLNYENMFGVDRLQRRDITTRSAKLKKAHKAIQEMRSTGIIRGHLSKDGTPEKVLFSQLPYVKEGNLNSPASIERLKEFGESLRFNVDTVVSFGIGGSYLGNKVLFDVQCGEFWNAKSQEWRNGYPQLYFHGQNMDPRRTTDLVERLFVDAEEKAAKGEKFSLCLVVISKSGATLDTMSTFMTVYEIFKSRPELCDLTVVAVTDPRTDSGETLLHKLAKEEGWEMFSVPDGVGGRFSIFSEVGLITAACIGFDIDGFLAGAKAMDFACQTEDVWQNPAMLNAIMKYVAGEKYGRDIEVFMPYADYLKSVSEWYIQLLAESLGKRLDRSGNEVYYGRTPIVAVGTTDMHAQTQQHQDGKRDKIVQFLRVENWSYDPIVPDCFPAVPKLHEIAGKTLSQALDAALMANAQALSGDNRMNAEFVLPAVSAYHLGELLYMLALSIAYEGEFADVDAFDQPGVEAYKRILGPLMNK